MRTISQARASARAYMLLEAAAHLRMDVCDNSLERQEANTLADRLEKEAQKWFLRGVPNPDDYEDACEEEAPTLRLAYSVT